MRSLLCALILCGCAHGPRPRLDARLHVDCPLPEATVLIDDRVVGPAKWVREHPLALPSGPHRVEVRAPGHFTGYYELRLLPQAPQRLAVDLRPVPPGESE